MNKFELTEEEIEKIYLAERKKFEGSSWEVELDYHKETFTSGIEVSFDYIKNKILKEVIEDLKNLNNSLSIDVGDGYCNDLIDKYTNA